MANSILLKNPVTIQLVNKLADIVGRSPHVIADLYLQSTAREALAEHESSGGNPLAKAQSKSASKKRS